MCTLTSSTTPTFLEGFVRRGNETDAEAEAERETEEAEALQAAAHEREESESAEELLRKIGAAARG